MPFIPHTEDDVKEMLQAMRVHSMADLFSEIPQALKISELSEIPDGVNEATLYRELKARSEKDVVSLNFIGAGAYEHHIPAPIWEIVSRGEWMTAYTPYQAEASQGTLQLLYEYQTMMARLMNMEVSNASLYDGASSLAEAILMAIRLKEPHHLKGEMPCILIPNSLHPFYRDTVKTIVQKDRVKLLELPFCPESGRIIQKDLDKISDQTITALIIPQPNFFGVLEDTDRLMEFAQNTGALVIGVVNPISMALLQPPGEWGGAGVCEVGADEVGRDKVGADIVCGEGQSLGIPLASGGPYFGFLCCKKEHIRQMPGRLIGRTVDREGKEGFTLTLQAREQHIRRAKATSNICTNQGLLVTAATLYLALLGGKGLHDVAVDCHLKSQHLKDKLKNVSGVSCLFEMPFFHELVLKFKVSLDKVIAAMIKKGIEPGFDLRPYYPELGECLLVCVTETKTEEDLNMYVNALQSVLQSSEMSVC